jgi:hypothetical protein
MGSQSSSKHSCDHLAKAFASGPAMLFVACLTWVATGQEAQAAGFKVTNIHFETNSSACDMGIQIGFDTEGVTAGAVEDPNGAAVYSFRSAGGMKTTGGQTEGFLEGIEPQITELMAALGCKPSHEEGESTLANLFAAWPSGRYTFTGQGNGTTLEGHDRLTDHIPAGPKISTPANGAVVPDAPVLIRWRPVTGPILPSLGPVDIVGYHTIVYEAGGEVVPQLDVDLPASETSVKVPAQFLKPNKTYQIEVLATEESGNQTITEGFFCTTGVTTCTAPERPLLSQASYRRESR